MDHSVVQRWLRSVIGPYVEKDRVFADVDRTLIAVSSLSPKTEVFSKSAPIPRTLSLKADPVSRFSAFNDGRTQLLLMLEGTIPIQFRNTTYNIPVAFWVPREYPRGSPMGFVVPTADMGIRKGPNVDSSGQIGGDYLVRWNSKPEACNLLDFVHDCQAMFGREPPVFARPKVPQSPSLSQQQQYATAPSPSTPRPSQAATPAPVTPNASFHAYNNGSPAHDARERPPPPAPVPDQNQAAPHRPPKPPSNPAYYSPGPRNSVPFHDYAPSPQANAALGNQPPPRQSGLHYSPAIGQDQYRRLSGANFGSPSSMPPSRSSSMTIPGPGPGPHSPQPHSAGPASSHRPWEQQQQSQPQRQPSISHGPPQPAQHTQNPSSQESNQRYSYQQPPPSSQQYPPSVPSHERGIASPAQNGQRAPLQTSAPPSVAPRPSIVNLLDDDDTTGPKASGASANGSVPGAPPPPRPMNPELLAMHDRLFSKIESRLVALTNSLEGSNQQLRVLSSDLDRGRPAIEDEMSRLRAVRDVCQITGDRLEETVMQARERVTMLRQKEGPDPDTMVMATSIVGNQLIDLVAEDNAIGDTLYQLGRALNAERIDLDRFLKQTRMLAREQFMKRALAHKISEGMGWS